MASCASGRQECLLARARRWRCARPPRGCARVGRGPRPSHRDGVSRSRSSKRSSRGVLDAPAGPAPSSVTTWTAQPRSSSRTTCTAPRSRRLRSGSSDTRKSMSLVGVAEPRATEPITRTSVAPKRAATSMISSRRRCTSARVGGGPAGGTGSRSDARSISARAARAGNSGEVVAMRSMFPDSASSLPVPSGFPRRRPRPDELADTGRMLDRFRGVGMAPGAGHTLVTALFEPTKGLQTAGCVSPLQGGVTGSIPVSSIAQNPEIDHGD